MSTSKHLVRRRIDSPLLGSSIPCSLQISTVHKQQYVELLDKQKSAAVNRCQQKSPASAQLDEDVLELLR